MSLRVSISFPLGRYHATPWDRHVNEGAIEWPPSPWRLVRALVAVWHDRCPELSEEAVLEVLNVVGDHPTYALPRSLAAGTRHYYPGSAQQLPKNHDTAKVLDTFRAVDPAAVLEVRWSGELSESGLKAATTLFERLGYLGRADSICEASVISDSDRAELVASEETLSAFPDQSGDHRLLAPELPIHLASITVQTDAMRAAGYAQPQASVLAHYRIEPEEDIDGHMTQPPITTVDRPQVAVLSVAGRPAPSHELALVVAERVRSALQSHFGRRNQHAASPTFAGHLAHAERPKHDDHRSDDHQHLHLLALPGPDRRIDRIVAWAPEGFGPEEVAALASISDIYPPGRGPGTRGDRSTAERERQAVRGLSQFRVALAALGKPHEVVPDLVGPSRVWRSATPMIPTGRPNRQDLADTKRLGGVALRFARRRMSRELHYRGLPAPASVEFLNRPPTAAQRYRRHRIGRTLKDARSATWLEIVFEVPQQGPLALGALSHLGMGLFLPVGEAG